MVRGACLGRISMGSLRHADKTMMTGEGQKQLETKERRIVDITLVLQLAA